jgi:hypothetical protein
VALIRFFASWLAQTKFGQRSLTKPDGLSILKQQPRMLVYVGLVLLAMSYLIGLPALAFLIYLSVKLNKPMIIAVGGPFIFLLVHIMFGMGVYLAGRNYAVEVLHWVTRRFLQKYA